MPHFHFNIRDGARVITDEEGMHCEDIDAARFEARASARDLLAEQIRAGQNPDGRTIEITEPDGKVIERVALHDVLYGYGENPVH